MQELVSYAYVSTPNFGGSLAVGSPKEPAQSAAVARVRGRIKPRVGNHCGRNALNELHKNAGVYGKSLGAKAGRTRFSM